MFDNYKQFLSDVFRELATTGIEHTNLEIDHIAYTAGSTEEYESLRPRLIGMGKLIAEDLVTGRRVGIVLLNEPLEYENKKIPGVELIEPILNVPTESRLDHIEFVIPMGFERFMHTYPHVRWDTSSMSRQEYPHLKIQGVRAKFHELSIFETIERQKRNKETLS